MPALYVPPSPGGSTSVGFVQPNNASKLLQGLPAVNPRLTNDEVWKNFAPRVGFAYQFTDGLALRGGYGIFFDRRPFPVLPLPSQFPLTPLLYSPPYSPTRPALATNAIDTNLKTPYTNQFALNLQWQPINSLLLEAGYVGSKGTHLATQRLINQALLASPSNPINGITTNTAANASLRSPFVGFSTSGLVYLEDDTDSSYNSLQLSATKRISRGLQFLVSYTFSKSLDNNSGASTSVFNTVSGDQNDLKQNRGLSDFDRRHRFVVNYIYEVPYWGFALPKNRITNTIFGGWELSGVTTWQSGSPFTINDSTGATLYGETTSRASWAPGASMATVMTNGSVESRLNGYFNAAAFVTAGTGWENTGRNILHGPSQANFDFSAVKNFAIVLIHGGVHANFDTSEAHIVRELIAQGYSVISSEYRGSTGYGRAFYEDIDYGGREVDDVYERARWMLENYDFLDAKRVGIMGWSHGGLITLMNIFQHPTFYAVAYAGVPVSDLVARLGYESESYQNLYSAKRSPVNHVKELQTPLLVHTNTADEDVNVLEVEHLIDSLKAEGKKFEYKSYENAPGGHHFNRTDTKLAKDSRKEVYRFLAGYLHPAHPPQ